MQGKIESFFSVHVYFSCKNCKCKCAVGDLVCNTCHRKIDKDLLKDFRYEVIVKRELNQSYHVDNAPDDQYSQLTGFLRSFNDPELTKKLSTPSNLDDFDLQDYLNEHFCDKDVTLDWNFNKKDDQKIVYHMQFH